MDNALDATDKELVGKRIAARAQIIGPRIGDYVYFPTGELERFSRDGGASFQTSDSGAFFLDTSGKADLTCGGLSPWTPRDQLKLTDVVLPGSFWFFHHDVVGAGRGVRFDIPCRVYTTTAEYTGFHRESAQSPKVATLKKQLAGLAP